VPKAISDLTHTFEYNNIDSLKSILNKLENKVAAVILEPMNTTYPTKDFLSSVKELTHKAGAVLIFDEVITGFRFSKGGAQELFGVTPDLSTFGKGIANGFPLSALVGKREIMLEMEKVFLSGTFGGELLSLAAAKSVLQRHLKEDICGDLETKGVRLADLTSKAISENQLEDVVSLSGHPSWKFINWQPTMNYSVGEIKTYFLQEIFQEGILVLNSHNVTTAHNKKILIRVSEAYNKVFRNVREAIDKNVLREQLKVKALVPLFKVR
jgi:glutamate-1-semialdehyde 2,1-aminomutase